MAKRKYGSDDVSSEQHLVNALRYVLRGGGEADHRAALDGLAALEAQLPEPKTDTETDTETELETALS